MIAHLWQKTLGPDRQAPQLVRAWRCRRCGATKVVTKRTADGSPRRAIERRVSREECAS